MVLGSHVVGSGRISVGALEAPAGVPRGGVHARRCSPFGSYHLALGSHVVGSGRISVGALEAPAGVPRGGIHARRCSPFGSYNLALGSHVVGSGRISVGALEAPAGVPRGGVHARRCSPFGSYHLALGSHVVGSGRISVGALEAPAGVPSGGVHARRCSPFGSYNLALGSHVVGSGRISVGALEAPAAFPGAASTRGVVPHLALIIWLLALMWSDLVGYRSEPGSACTLAGPVGNADGTCLLARSAIFVRMAPFRPPFHPSSFILHPFPSVSDLAWGFGSRGGLIGPIGRIGRIGPMSRREFAAKAAEQVTESFHAPKNIRNPKNHLTLQRL